MSCPGILGLVGGVQREFDIRRRRARDLAESLPGDWAGIIKVASLGWRYPLTPDKIVVSFADEELLRDLIQSLLKHGISP